VKDDIFKYDILQTF